MGRSNKKGLDYFPMNVDFFEDDKLQLIEAEFGLKGSVVAIRLLCKIYKEGYFYQWGDDQCLLFTKSVGGGIVSSLVNEIVKGLVKRGFFNEAVFTSFGVLTSKGIQNRFFDIAGRLKKVDVFSEYLLVDVSKMVNVTLMSIDVTLNPIDVTLSAQRKRKEIKRKEKKERDFTPEKIFFIDIEKVGEFLKEDQSWCDVICMQNKITIIQLEPFIISFVELLKSRGETGKTPNDAKSHFANWFKCEQTKKQKKLGSNIATLTGKEIYTKF